MTTGPHAPTLHARIAAQAARDPRRTAVTFEGESLDFGTLDARADRLARHLRSLGAGPDVAVGVCVERGFDLPVALLATLKAGATYVPLDPAVPSQRLRQMVRDTDAAVILAHARFVAPLEGLEPHVVVLDRELPAIAEFQALPPTSADDLACIIFTSGTSGRPKGVLIDHRALSERFERSPYKHLCGPGDVVAAITAASWIPSVYELLFTLANGGRVALAPTDVVRDPLPLGRFLDEAGVTFMRAVPSLWRSLVEHGWAGKADLAIVCHGERLDGALAKALRSRGRGLWNTYGSTEATVFTALETDDHGTTTHLPGPDVGDLRVLDEAMVELPPGVSGELFVAGPVLARGYLADPALTNARFLLDSQGTRLFRTGDLARRRDDGRLEFLGRADRQVKLRGQRIEPGEIEAAILTFDGVKEALVVARPDAAGQPRLVAYLVGTPDTAALRAGLAARLPEVMVPAAFVLLAALPRTPAGKLDVAALPDPPRSRPALGTRYAAPETPTEAAFSRIFAEALGLDLVGIDDHFFELGGHSLLAARVASRILRDCDLDVDLATFFAAPTIRSLVRALGGATGRARVDRPAPIVRVKERQGVPLSHAQERLWFMDRLTPEAAGYNLPSALALSGPLDVDALRRGLQHILDRHEALRTSISADHEGRPVQTVHDGIQLEVPVIELTGGTDDERQARARAILVAESLRPFDLGRPPLFRALLLRLAPDSHILFTNLHHIASDGWSKAVLRRELGVSYNDGVQGRAPSLLPLPLQYVDFAAWQRAALENGRLANQVAYWKQQLEGLEPLELTPDRPRPRVLTQHGAQEIRVVPKALLEALGRLAHTHDATLFMVLLSAFQALLFRHTGQHDFAVASPVAGRPVPELEALIGFFVNSLVLRARVTGDDLFLDLLARARSTTLDALVHQELPFEKLVAELNPERDASRHPLTQAVFALQNTPFDNTPFHGLEDAPYHFRNETTRFDLELHAWERADGLHCHLTYNTDLFDAERMRALLQQFERILKQVVDRPDRMVSSLELLTPDEREQLLVGSNENGRELQDFRPVHARIADHARLRPDALAVQDPEGALSFAQLDQRASRLARFLRQHGVGPGDRVAQCLVTSTEAVVTTLATWKLGAVFVPLDPSYPDERLAFMLRDVVAKLLVARGTTAQRLSHVGVPCLDPAAADRECPAENSTISAPPDSPDASAYVIYTSGSTGRPNGVEVPHRALCNLVQWHIDTTGLQSTDRVSAVASPAFDASIIEAWPALAAGASVHVPTGDLRRDPASLLGWLDRNRVSVAFLPTPLLEAALDVGFRTDTSLRVVFTGGDRLLRRPPAGLPFTLFNHYGPTENAVAATFAIVQPDDVRPPPIGLPISNTQVFVLDPAMQPVPLGVPGELFLGGASLATGYLGNPTLTAERFIPNPFGAGRLYRTGDRVRFRADGALEFLGRVDAQVKVRGYRIEPGEIDAQLLRIPGVRASLTVARDDGPVGQRLVSYVIPTPPGEAMDDPEAVDFIARWQRLYDTGNAQPVADPAFDISGWNSSVTGRPFPSIEMKAWVEATVAQVRETSPQEVLELGCGTGLLLFPLAPTVRRYVASDLSTRAISAVSKHVSSLPGLPSKVALTTRPAHDLGWLGDATFDTVILNSVIQYFPSATYLTSVLVGAAARTRVGGRLFIGDVRDLRLLGAFHEEVERGRAGADPGSLQERVAAACRNDKELLVDPAYFHALVRHIPRLSGVSIRPKSAGVPAELARYRYDVVLSLDEPIPAGFVRPEPPAADTGSPLTSDPLRPWRAASLVRELRTQLALRLPEFMVPASFVVLEALPLTPNGKVDRRRLPAPGGERSGQPVETERPRSPTERAIATLFCESIGLEHVGLLDNFFELGGHSLLAVQVVTRIHDRLGVDLPLAALFEAPTVEGLAARVESSEIQPEKAPASLPEDTLTTLPITPADANFHYGRLSLGAGPNAWYQVLELELDPVDAARLEVSILAAVNKHPMARGRLTSTTDFGPGVVWDVSKRLARAPLETIEAATEGALATIRERIAQTPFPLDEAPSCRFVLVRTPTRDHLLVRHSHRAIDASGLQALLDSIMSHYLGRPDPATRVRPFDTSELLAHHGRTTRSLETNGLLANNELSPLARVLKRPSFTGAGLREFASRVLRPGTILPATIHGSGGEKEIATGAHAELEFTTAMTTTLNDAVRRLRSTLDRLFAVGLVQGAAAWNRTFPGNPGRIEVAWVVNLRPPRHFKSVVANHFAWSRLRAPEPDAEPAWQAELLDPSSDVILQGALDWLEIVDDFHTKPMSAPVRWVSMHLVRRMLPSLFVSNTLPFGQFDEGPFVRDFGLRRTHHHSHFGLTDRPILVINRRDGKLLLRMLYPRSMFDAAGAGRFLACCRDEVLRLAETAG